MHAYYKAMPSQNPLISDRMYRRSLKQHKKKLKAITAHIDNKPPRHWKNKPKRNLKREQMMEERMAGIERENKLLLEKMAVIMKKSNSLNNLNTRKPKSLNHGFRQRELERITEQNLAILKRIQSSEPAYNHQKWIEERKRHESYLKNIAIHKKQRLQMNGKLQKRPATSQVTFRRNLTQSMTEFSSLDITSNRPRTSDTNFQQDKSMHSVSRGSNVSEINKDNMSLLNSKLVGLPSPAESELEEKVDLHTETKQDLI